MDRVEAYSPPTTPQLLNSSPAPFGPPATAGNDPPPSTSSHAVATPTGSGGATSLPSTSPSRKTTTSSPNGFAPTAPSHPTNCQPKSTERHISHGHCTSASSQPEGASSGRVLRVDAGNPVGPARRALAGGTLLEPETLPAASLSRHGLDPRPLALATAVLAAADLDEALLPYDDAVAQAHRSGSILALAQAKGSHLHA